MTLLAHLGFADTGTGANLTSSALDTSGGNFLIVCVSGAGAGAASVSDNKTNSWTQVSAIPTGAVPSTIFYAYNATCGTGHTFTIVQSGIYPSVQIQAHNNISTTAPADPNNSNQSAAAATIQPGSVTPTADGELIVVVAGGNWSGTVTIDSSFTITDQHVGTGGSCYAGAAAYLYQTPAAGINPTWSDASTNLYSAVVATFKAPGGAPPPPIDTVPLIRSQALKRSSFF